MSHSPFKTERVSGFGRGHFDECLWCEPSTLEELSDAIAWAKENGKKIVLRGNGRSYGDAAIAPQALCISLAKMNQIEISGGLAIVESGATFSQIWQKALPLGFWPPVVTGTSLPTIGGAIAMNVHGKNAYSSGTLGEHLDWVEVLTLNGDLRRIQTGDEDFWTVVGGTGLFGIIVKAAIRLRPVVSPYLMVSAKTFVGWNQALELLEHGAKTHDYAVGWADMMGPLKGELHFANYSENPADLSDATSLAPQSSVLKTLVVKTMPILQNRWLMARVNQMKYTMAHRADPSKSVMQSLPEFHFLLDALPGWESMYGGRGMMQYQVFAPYDNAEPLFSSIESKLKGAHFAPHLAVLKRHKPTPALVSYSCDGFSLAMDFPMRLHVPTIRRLFDDLTDEVLAAGGRFYFAKDSTLTKAQAKMMLGEETCQKFMASRRRFDPELRLTSGLARRIGLDDGSILD